MKMIVMLVVLGLSGCALLDLEKVRVPIGDPRARVITSSERDVASHSVPSTLLRELAPAVAPGVIGLRDSSRGHIVWNGATLQPHDGKADDCSGRFCQKP